MGAWSHEPFGNDDAGDWVWELEKRKDFSLIEDALDAVTREDEYLEAPECCEALAAAEIVAALLERPSASLPDNAAAWVVGKPRPPESLIKKANIAVGTVLRSSELQELWEDSDYYEEWQSVTKDLQDRLRQTRLGSQFVAGNAKENFVRIGTMSALREPRKRSVKRNFLPSPTPRRQLCSANYIPHIEIQPLAGEYRLSRTR